MSNLSRRLGKIEKQLHIEKPHLVNIAGFEIMSDELGRLIKKIGAEGRGLQIKEYQAVCAGDTEK